MIVITVRSCSRQNVELTWITLAIVIPILTVATDLVHARLPSVATCRVRDGIFGVLGDLSESLQGVRTVAAFNRQRWNVVQHRNVVGAYRDANNYTAQVNAIYGPGTQMLGYLGQGALLAIGGNMVVHHQLKLGVLVAFFLYLNRFFAPIQLLVQRAATPSSRANPRCSSCGRCSAPSRARRKSRTRSSYPRSTARSSLRMLASATSPTNRFCATITSASPPVRRSRS